MHWKKLVLISGSAGATIALVSGLFYLGVVWQHGRVKPPKSWNAAAIKATYIGAQLRGVDRGNASLVLYYSVQNDSGSDYQFSDASGIVIMSRLRSDGSLSSEERIRLSYPTFLPAYQRARIALEVLHPFDWPADSDPARQEKLRDFVNRRLADVDGFVLFDQADRCQIEFPRGWQELQLVSAARK